MKFIITIYLFLVISPLAICQNTILWKVTDPINHKTSFVLGTHHLFGNSFVDSIPEIKESLYSSELAVFESIDEVSSTQEMINSRESSLELKKKLNKKELRKLIIISKEWEVDIYKLKPVEIRWKLNQLFIETKCETVNSTDNYSHFDNYLIHLSKEKNIRIIGLETDSLQLSVIEKEYNPSWKSERKKIVFWINQLTSDNPDLTFCQFTDNYRKFKLDYKFNEDCEDHVSLFQRNNDWMVVIPDLLREKNVFIAVGYLHLTRKCGILEQLKSNGFKVEPVKLK